MHKGRDVPPIEQPGGDDLSFVLREPRYRRSIIDMDFLLILMVTDNTWMCASGFDEGTEIVEMQRNPHTPHEIALLLYNPGWPMLEEGQAIPLHEVAFLQLDAPAPKAPSGLVLSRS